MGIRTPKKFPRHLPSRATSSASISSIVVASIAERQAHHPDIALHYGKVTLNYSTHDAGHQVSAKDLKAVGAVEAYLAL